MRESDPEYRRLVGERIEKARLAAGYTNQSEFARLTGIRGTTLYRYEKGKGLPSGPNATRIALVSGVSTDWIFCATDDPRRGDATGIDDLGSSPFDFWIEHATHPALTNDQKRELRALAYRPQIGAVLYYNVAWQLYTVNGLRGKDLQRATEYTAMITQQRQNRSKKRS
jgi:transcriptional regulator with XRE-family HTH domain